MASEQIEIYREQAEESAETVDECERCFMFGKC